MPMATVEATMEMPMATVEATMEMPMATVEATMEMTVEPMATMEMTVEPMATMAATAEATMEMPMVTMEATMAATAEPMAMATMEATAEMPTGPQTFVDSTGRLTFVYPEGVTQRGGDKQVILDVAEGETLSVYTPLLYSDVVRTEQTSDLAALSFFLTRVGLTVSSAEMDMMATAEAMATAEPMDASMMLKGELAQVAVSLPRNDQEGMAYLVDLENGRRAVIVWLAPVGAAPSTALVEALTSVTDTLVAPADLVDVAMSNPDFSILVEALVAADLVTTLREGEFTVFAPTNAAFEATLGDMSMTKEDLLANPELANILTYHVIPGTVLSTDIVAGDVATVNGANVTISVAGGVVMVNDATVVAADVTAVNGVIHVIDKVLMPPAPEPVPTAEVPMATAEPMATMEATMEAPMATMEATSAAAMPATVVEVAMGASDFSTLVNAVVAADLVEMLSDETASYTVFAPTNEAFAAALEGMGMTAEELLSEANRETLVAILTYHVIPSRVLSSDLVAGDVTTAQGEDVTITITGSKVMVNDANVVTADIESGNGIVHVIDKVLVPPTLR